MSVTCTCQTGAAMTSGTGTYSFANIAPGTSYSMTFTDPSYVTDTISPVVVTAGSPTTESPALTEDGGSITGTVTDGTASGNPPIAGVSVTCTCQTGGTMTNGSGAYSFINEPPGTNYSLTFTDPGYVTDTVPVVVTAGTLTTENVSLTEDGGGISGTVTDATASGNPPIAGVSVTCTCQTGGTMTNGSGGYSFINEPPGTNYSLTFTDAGYVTGTISGVNVTAGSDHPESIALTEDGSISGTVTDATASGNPPIAGVSVTCTCQTGAATTSGTGTYSFANIAPGTSYSMTFTDPSYVTDTISPVVVTAGSPTTESPALTEDGGSITGTVTDGTASGNPPIAGVSVTCTCQTGGTMTNGSGGYSFINVPPGTNYSLTFTDAGYATDTVSPVVVTAGTLTTQNVALTESASSGLSMVRTFGSVNTTQATTLTASPITGSTGNDDLLVVTVKGRSSPLFAVTGVSDNSSGLNHWSLATSTHNGQAFEAIYFAPDAAAVTDVTVTVSGASSLSMTVVDIAGASTTSPLDQDTNNTGTSAAASTGVTPSTSSASEIVVADIGWNSALTLSSTTSGYTTLAVEQSTAKLGLPVRTSRAVRKLPGKSSASQELKASEACSAPRP